MLILYPATLFNFLTAFGGFLVISNYYFVFSSEDAGVLYIYLNLRMEGFRVPYVKVARKGG